MYFPSLFPNSLQREKERKRDRHVNDRVVLEYVMGIFEERDTWRVIKYEDDVIYEYVDAVSKFLYTSDLTHLVFYEPPSVHFLISWTRSMQTSFSQASLYHWLCRSLKENKYLLSLAFRSVINDLPVLVCVCALCERVSWCVCLMMKRVMFFLLWCGRLRSRCTGIQINSIERSLIGPLRPARKLKLMMEWGGKTMRERHTHMKSSKKKERGRWRWMRKKNLTTRKWRGKAECRGDKRREKTFESKNIGTGQLTRSLFWGLGTHSRQRHERGFGILCPSFHPLLGARERRRGGRQREERGWW